MAKLKTYRSKRDFGKTQEPRGALRQTLKGHRYVIQKHAATRLHYDLRLELDGVMLSWAVTRGPSLVPGEKRLAIHVEDHPIEYNKFEGTIPKGEYGGGTVMIWDRGTWEPEHDPHEGMKKGHLDFALDGEKLTGRWHLVRMRKRPGERQEPWLLIKSGDEFARRKSDPDVLEENDRSVATGRSMEEIATGRKRIRPAAKAPDSTERRKQPKKTQGPSGVTVAGVNLTHPDRVYWPDAGVTKQMLAEYYTKVWDWMRPHVTGRVLALLRCPEGQASECFFQKHASAGLDNKYLRAVKEPGGKTSIAIDDLAGLIALVQAGVLEVHLRGSAIEHLEQADRLVFDLDPGPGVVWKDVIVAAREVRRRLDALKLKSFVKTTGGKGLHVVVPIRPTGWDDAKAFCRMIADAMVHDAPQRYTATVKKSARNNRVFIDYLRNSREATAVAPYSTRARSGATVSTPLSWDELGQQKTPNGFTVENLPRRLARMRRDPWDGIVRLKQTLPRTR